VMCNRNARIERYDCASGSSNGFWHACGFCIGCYGLLVLRDSRCQLAAQLRRDAVLGGLGCAACCDLLEVCGEAAVAAPGCHVSSSLTCREHCGWGVTRGKCKMVADTETSSLEAAKCR
jgi:hypothetical protein